MTDEEKTAAEPEKPAPDKPEKAKAKAEKSDLPALSLDTFLFWTGDDTRALHGVPARDLHGSDLQRQVYVNDRLLPGESGYDDAMRALIERLVDSGLYARGDKR